MFAIADHQAIPCIESLLGKQVREKISLVVETTIQRRAIHTGQITPKTEMRDDFLREVLGLGRAQKCSWSGARCGRKHVRHARIDRVFAPTQFGETLAIEC